MAWLSHRAQHISKAVKGVLLAMAAALALELTSDAGAAALALLGSVIAVLFGNVYADWLQGEIEQGRRLGLVDLGAVAWRSIGVVAGAAPAFVLFLLAWLELLSLEQAIDATIYVGIAMLLGFGFVGGRLRGDPRSKALFYGVLLAALGVFVMVIKSFL